MPLVVLTAKVKDGAAWEKGFRTHGDLFKAAGLGTINYKVSDDAVVMVTDVPDVDAYMEFMQSDSTRKAMKGDGVKRKSVKLHVIDKEFGG